MAVASLMGAVAFYTCLPVPQSWAVEFRGIARWAPVIGLGIGGILGSLDIGMQQLGMPVLVRSAAIVAVWIAITGGLHLDGAIDTADGLAVLDPTRRLQVMADSRSGAFGVMAAGVILLLKTTAVANLESHRWLALMGAAGWGRWGQLVAIAHYPYLKPEGKGAFHKQSIRSLWSVVPSLLLLLAVGIGSGYWSNAGFASRWLIGGGTIALAIGAWLNHRFGGQTGDTYGAIVEWTEALLLCLLTIS